MVLVWRQGGSERRQEIAGDWEAAAKEARRLIMLAGATNVAIHEEA